MNGWLMSDQKVKWLTISGSTISRVLNICASRLCKAGAMQMIPLVGVEEVMCAEEEHREAASIDWSSAIPGDGMMYRICVSSLVSAR